MGKLAVLSNVQTPTQMIKEKEETGKHGPKNENKIKLQKVTLIKWKCMIYLTENFE